MALNRVYAQQGKYLPNLLFIAQTVARTSNEPISGDPCVCGELPGVALENADANGRCVVQADGIFDLLVAGINSSGVSGADANVAVNGGDIVYFDQSKTPPISKRAGGVPFGRAIGDSGVQVVASGVTTTKIPVQVGV